MNIEKTEDIDSGDGIVMVVYGGPKKGKTTFGASMGKFGKTLLIDFENGGKYLGERGFRIDTIRMKDWFTDKDSAEIKETIKDYDNIIVDPVGEAMDFLITGSRVRGGKLRQSDGTLTQAGWGEAKSRLRGFIKFLKSTGKNIVLVFHEDRYKFEDEIYHSILIPTKLKEVIPGMVEIISFLAVTKNEAGESKRFLYTPAMGGNYDSGDRTGRVPEKVEISEENGWGDFLASLKPKTTTEEPIDIELSETEQEGNEINDTPLLDEENNI